MAWQQALNVGTGANRDGVMTKTTRGYYHEIARKDGREYPRWVAHWREHGEQRFRRFSYGHKRTEEEALALAVAHRNAQTGMAL